MKQIKLSAADQVERTGHTSKGDQPKWQIRDVWYKADHMGYESLAEIVASRMLERSSLSDFLLYEPVLIQMEDRLLPGCSSRNFRGKQEMLIPLERLHRAYHGEGLGKAVSRQQSLADKIRYTVDFVVRVTGLETFGRYLATIFELDAFLLNEDRHTNNLAVIRDETSRKFRLCPLFDHGLSLLSDTGDYPIEQDIYACIARVKAKPFAPDFLEQAETASNLYGSDLHFFFGTGDISALLSGLDQLYDQRTLQRVEQIIREQMRKYGYLFSRK